MSVAGSWRSERRARVEFGKFGTDQANWGLLKVVVTSMLLGTEVV